MKEENHGESICRYIHFDQREGEKPLMPPLKKPQGPLLKLNSQNLSMKTEAPLSSN